MALIRKRRNAAFSTWRPPKKNTGTYFQPLVVYLVSTADIVGDLITVVRGTLVCIENLAHDNVSPDDCMKSPPTHDWRNASAYQQYLDKRYSNLGG